MTLRDALAAALDGVLPRMAFEMYGKYLTDDPLWDIEAYYQRVSSEVLSDPAFRAALTEAVAEVLRGYRYERMRGPVHDEPVVREGEGKFAAAIVARLVGDDHAA